MKWLYRLIISFMILLVKECFNLPECAGRDAESDVVSKTRHARHTPVVTTYSKFGSDKIEINNSRDYITYVFVLIGRVKFRRTLIQSTSI